MNLRVGQRLGDWSVVALMPVPKHVGFAEDSTGRHGVLKISKGGVYNDTRFHEEAAGMQGLVGQKGVLQLVDVEPSTCPRWMVTERAVLLTEHLGLEPDLRSAVELFEQMANTLARLKSDKGIAHRDLKPPNMFVVDGRAVVGDFGIATWPGRAADLTEDGRGVGPIHFMAPETRSYNAKVDPFAADVYALAASLWAAAAGVPYPPAGVLKRPGKRRRSTVRAASQHTSWRDCWRWRPLTGPTTGLGWGSCAMRCGTG